MSKKAITIFVILISCKFIIAQQQLLNYRWAHTIGKIPLGGQVTQDFTKIDQQGNLFIAGRFDNTVLIPSINNTITLTSDIWQKSFYFAKYDSTGNCLWAKSINFKKTAGETLTSGCGAVSIDVDGNGSLIVAGSYVGTVDFNPDQLVEDTLKAINYRDAFMAKYNGNGDFLWAKSIGSTGDDQVRKVRADRDNNIFIVYSGSSNTDFDPSSTTYTIVPSIYWYGFPYFLGKYDANGNLIFVKNIAKFINSESGAMAFDVNIRYDGKIVLTGGFKDSVNFDSPLNNNVLYERKEGVFQSIYESDGQFIKAYKLIGGLDMVAGYRLQANNDSLGNMYLTATISKLDTLDLDPSINNVNVLSASNREVVLTKFDSAGNYLWNNKISQNAEAFASFTDKAGNTYVDGIFTNTIDFDNSSAIFNLTPISNTMGHDMFLVKYNTNGNFQFATKVVSLTKNAMDPTALCVEKNHNIYIGGTFTTPYNEVNYVDFDLSVNNVLYEGPNTYGFFAKYKECTADNIYATTSSTSICNGSTATLTASGAQTYTWSTMSQNNPFIVSPTVNTNYLVSGSSPNGCVNTTSVQVNVKSCVGVKEYEKGDIIIQIIPNPNNGEFFIKSEIEIKLILINVVGNKIASYDLNGFTDYKVKSDVLPKGIYFLVSEDYRASKKIVIE